MIHFRWKRSCRDPATFAGQVSRRRPVPPLARRATLELNRAAQRPSRFAIIWPAWPAHTGWCGTWSRLTGAVFSRVSKGVVLGSNELSDIAARTDAWTCQASAQLLRARWEAGVAGEDWSPEVDRLLCAVARELEADPDSIPTAVRWSTIQLAERIGQRCPIPAPRSATDHGMPIGEPRHLSNGANRDSVVPFTRSQRLGRMG